MPNLDLVANHDIVLILLREAGDVLRVAVLVIEDGPLKSEMIDCLMRIEFVLRHSNGY